MHMNKFFVNGTVSANKVK